jgi:hypothetical protein
LMNLIYIVLKNNNKATVQGVAKCSNRWVCGKFWSPKL